MKARNDDAQPLSTRNVRWTTGANKTRSDGMGNCLQSPMPPASDRPRFAQHPSPDWLLLKAPKRSRAGRPTAGGKLVATSAELLSESSTVRRPGKPGFRPPTESQASPSPFSDEDCLAILYLFGVSLRGHGGDPISFLQEANAPILREGRLKEPLRAPLAELGGFPAQRSSV